MIRTMILRRAASAAIITASLIGGCSSAATVAGDSAVSPSPSSSNAAAAPPEVVVIGDGSPSPSPLLPEPEEVELDGLTCAAAVTLDEIGTVSGRDDWQLTSDDDEMPDTDMACEFDRGELYSYGWQHLDVNLWSGDTAARFLSSRLPGDPVALGDGAAWDPIGTRLLVRVGDRVLGIDSGEFLGDTEGQSGSVQLAGMILARID